MKRREFLTGLAGAAAVVSASQVLAEAATEPMNPEMHAPKYKALTNSTARCVASGDDCMRHCFGMFSMNDTSMVGCFKAVYEMVILCGALQSLAALNSPHVPALAKAAADACIACKKECEKYPSIAECKACAEACDNCAGECKKAAA